MKISLVFFRWRSLDFRLLPHLGKDTFIITGFEEILQQLEESQVILPFFLSERYFHYLYLS